MRLQEMWKLVAGHVWEKYLEGLTWSSVLSTSLILARSPLHLAAFFLTRDSVLLNLLSSGTTASS